jgi:hypothetical protein
VNTDYPVDEITENGPLDQFVYRFLCKPVKWVVLNKDDDCERRKAGALLYAWCFPMLLVRSWRKVLNYSTDHHEVTSLLDCDSCGTIVYVVWR